MAEYPGWLAPLLGFIFGLQFGSFITLASFRLPEGQDIIVTPSRCPNCMHRLSILDLFPVVSWALSGRRCRYCRAPISARYPIIEIIAGGFGALLCVTTPPFTVVFAVKAFAMIFGWCAAVMAFEKRRVSIWYFIPYSAYLIMLTWALPSPPLAVMAVFIGFLILWGKKSSSVGLLAGASCALATAYEGLGAPVFLVSIAIIGLLIALPKTRAHDAEAASHTFFVLFVALSSSII